jgi:hypothetical protein
MVCDFKSACDGSEPIKVIQLPYEGGAPACFPCSCRLRASLEKHILDSGETNEKEAVRRLVEVRVRKGARHAGFHNARKAVAAQIDVITYNLG